MLAYASDDPRQKGYSYQNYNQAEVYVDPESLFKQGEGRLYAASSGVMLYDGPIPWTAFSGARWRFHGGQYRTFFTKRWSDCTPDPEQSNGGVNLH
eukprot:12920286-Prorocentrum_lima.AAC.1